MPWEATALLPTQKVSARYGDTSPTSMRLLGLFLWGSWHCLFCLFVFFCLWCSWYVFFLSFSCGALGIFSFFVCVFVGLLVIMARNLCLWVSSGKKMMVRALKRVQFY